MVGAWVAVSANRPMPTGCFAGGSRVRMMAKDSGIRVPPVSPASARNTSMDSRFQAIAHSVVKNMNSRVLTRM